MQYGHGLLVFEELFYLSCLVFLGKQMFPQGLWPCLFVGVVPVEKCLFHIRYVSCLYGGVFVGVQSTFFVACTKIWPCFGWGVSRDVVLLGRIYVAEASCCLCSCIYRHDRDCRELGDSCLGPQVVPDGERKQKSPLAAFCFVGKVYLGHLYPTGPFDGTLGAPSFSF